MHPPIATYGAVIAVVITVPAAHHASHLVLAPAIHAGIAFFRSPAGTYPNVFRALLIFAASLIGLLRRPLWLNPISRGLIRRW